MISMNLKNQLKELDASDEVKEKISKEISRFKGMAASAAEATVQRGYLETVLALPWNKKSEDSEDLENAWKVLEEGHYGLKEIKERIMEFLAVRKLTHKGKSPILCLVGPPGTGKNFHCTFCGRGHEQEIRPHLSWRCP